MNRRIRKLKDEVNAEIARLHAVNDGLRPSEVVDAAKAKDSPLHDSFEWDNRKAGHEYRLIQARHLIRVAVIEAPGAAKPEPYVHVPASDAEAVAAESREGVYRPLSVVVQDNAWFGRALEAARASYISALRRMEELQRAAEAECDDDTIAKVNLALAALQTANTALAVLH